MVKIGCLTLFSPYKSPFLCAKIDLTKVLLSLHFLPMHLYRTLICLVLMIGLLTGCQTDNRPDNLVDTDKMANILTDVHLAEARVSRLGVASIDSSNLMYKRFESRILRKHGVDTMDYEKSYVYYSSHPREMEVIYKQIVEKLEKELATSRKKPAKS